MEFFDFFEKWIFFNVINRFKTVLMCVPRLEKRENSRKKIENRSIVANFNHIL
jgi:hypothetical protein